MTSPDVAEDRAERAPRTYMPHARVVLSGTIGPSQGLPVPPVEAFAFGLSLVRPGPASQAEADSLWNICSTYFSNASSQIGIFAQLRQVKVSDTDANGKLVGSSFAHVGYTVGGTNNAVYPPQVSLVVSLGTGLRGGTHRGRVYLPMPAAAVGQDLEISSADRASAEAAFVTFIQTINAQYAGQPGVVVASSKGFNTKVTTVRVGRALDTMRTRRKKLPENYDPGSTV